jgi:uncharacterized membrane protein YqjE
VISEYLDTLQVALRFDSSLARRVRKEFEDHLREAVAADPCEDRRQAEQRAVANCGDPRAIATELAIISLARRTKRLAVVIVLVLVGMFLLMRGLMAWYAAIQWAISDDMKPLAATIGIVIRYTFWTATLIGAAAWVYGSLHRLPSDYAYAQYSRHLSRFRILSSIATAALLVCVLSAGTLTMIRLISTSPSVAFFIPVLSVALELLAAGTLVILIWGLTRQAELTAGLQKASRHQ